MKIKNTVNDLLPKDNTLLMIVSAVGVVAVLGAVAEVAGRVTAAAIRAL